MNQQSILLLKAFAITLSTALTGVILANENHEIRVIAGLIFIVIGYFIHDFFRELKKVKTK